ncbi:MAG: SecD/SecF family protein translocase subunit [Clostridia bacterium]|nr:SecD/SecF family protein translocase subunit [Clostridia bacterium]
MKRVPKFLFIILALLIASLSVLTVIGVYSRTGDNETAVIKGIKDIRWGIDIKGGVEATFKPEGDYKATEGEIESAKAIIETRLVANNITDYELYADASNGRIIVRYPWKEDEKNFDPEKAIQEISATAELTFKAGSTYESETLVDGSMVSKAEAGVDNAGNYLVSLEMNEEGTSAFADATEKQLNDVLSIWMDDVMISSPTVNSVISDGKSQITGDFTAEEANDLATKINAGALPFKLETVSFGSVSPTLGSNSLSSMAIAGAIAMVLVSLFLIIFYRLPGFISVIALCGQMALTIASISGFFPVFNSFTMTLPGIAGLILSIGIGCDANIITAERIKEELRTGKSVERAVYKGCQNSLWAIVDGNMTIVIVSVILMLVFGPSNILSRFFGLSTTGAIYSFGYTLLMGVISNFIMSVLCGRTMFKACSGIKSLRKNWLWGGKK